MSSPTVIRALTCTTTPGLSVVLDGPDTQACLTQFLQWLWEGGYSAGAIRSNYASVARQALCVLSDTYWALEPDEVMRQACCALEQRDDLRPQTKRVYRLALAKLREFLVFQRGQPLPVADPLALPPELAELAAWLREPLSRYLRLKQRNWPARSVCKQTRDLFHRLRRVIGFFLTRYGPSDWSQWSVHWADEYVDAALRRGLTPGSINWELTNLRMFCRFVQDEGYPVPAAMTRLKLLEMPRRLPRPLSDEQVHQLERCVQSAIAAAPTDYRRQQAVMDLAWFYLLWHCGLRLSEVRDLRLTDLDLSGRKLFVRDSKDRKDRAIYLSDTTVAALRQHLATRGDAQAAWVFSVHRRVPTLGTLERRLARYGQQVGVSLTPHRLRHTFASQMLAAGMPVTSLQRYLGHEELDTTMIYAEVSDPMLQQDYYRGIATVDPPSAQLAPPALAAVRQTELRRLMAELQTAALNPEQQRIILEQMQRLLDESS